MLVRTRCCSEHPIQGAGEDELQKANRRKASALPLLTRHGARWDREVLCAKDGVSKEEMVTCNHTGSLFLRKGQGILSVDLPIRNLLSK